MIHFALAACAALFVLGPGDDCPDRVTKPVDVRIVYGQAIDCGGVQTQVGGIPINTGGQCPSFVLITPPRNMPEDRPGSNSYVRQIGSVDVTLLTYTCQKSYLLFIPISSSCVLVNRSVIARLPIYAEFPCADLRRDKGEDS